MNALLHSVLPHQGRRQHLELPGLENLVLAIIVDTIILLYHTQQSALLSPLHLPSSQQHTS